MSDNDSELNVMCGTTTGKGLDYIVGYDPGVNGGSAIVAEFSEGYSIEEAMHYIRIVMAGSMAKVKRIRMELE